MSKVHISPIMIAIIADNCKTIEDLQALLMLIEKTAHPYQIGWVQGKIENMRQKIREQESKGLCIDETNIREYRLKHNLSQTKLGSVLGVTYHTIIRWEQGKHVMSRQFRDLASGYFTELQNTKTQQETK